jgi:lipopolysaccharide transport system ATP-binding protein
VVGLCNRAILLEQGRIKAYGPAKDVTELYLEAMYSEIQDTRTIEDGPNEPALTIAQDNHTPWDQRLKYINVSQYRNDIQLFSFEENAKCFGTGAARIVDVKFLDPDSGRPLSWVVGGERVRLVIRCVANQKIAGPICGFYIKDRLGQPLFGDNTYLTHKSLVFNEGKHFEASFVFRFPILPRGEYMVAAALAEGTQDDHVQHHWIHDALPLTSISTSACTGLVGIMMERISLNEIRK